MLYDAVLLEVIDRALRHSKCEFQLAASSGDGGKGDWRTEDYVHWCVGGGAGEFHSTFSEQIVDACGAIQRILRHADDPRKKHSTQSRHAG